MKTKPKIKDARQGMPGKRQQIEKELLEIGGMDILRVRGISAKSISVSALPDDFKSKLHELYAFIIGEEEKFEDKELLSTESISEWQRNKLRFEQRERAGITEGETAE